jgi:chromosome segregation protein
MEERGVSKTVSMRFNADRGEAEAPAPNLAESVRGARVRSESSALATSPA